jgi:hypothetical protein
MWALGAVAVNFPDPAKSYGAWEHPSAPQCKMARNVEGPDLLVS